jgi:MFS family permease
MPSLDKNEPQAPAARPAPRGGELWGHSDFRKLWLGQSVSLVGTFATQLVFPLVAVTYLAASSAELGVISALQFLPVLFMTPFAGYWVDTFSRRGLLIGTNLARMAVLGGGIALLNTDNLRVWSWCVVVLLMGTFTSVFDVAWHSYLPSVLDRRQLVEGNTKMQASYSIAQVSGSGLGGLLLKVMTPAAALALDLASYVLATVSFLLIKRREAPRGAPEATESFRYRFTHGFRVLWRDRLLRTLMIEGSWFNFCEQALLTLFVVFAVRTLGFDTWQVGLCVALGGAGAVAGSFVARRLGDRWGVSRTLTIGMGVASAGPVLIPLAQGRGPVSMALIVVSFAFYGIGLSVFNVFNVSQRQARTDPAALGRVTAAFRMVALGALPVGAFAGGLAGQWLGLRTGVVVIAVALLAGWAVFAVALRRIPATESTT